MNEPLKQAMTPEQYQQLMVNIAQYVTQARAVGRKEALEQGSPLRGFLKSYTVWLGAAMLSFPDWWPLIAEQLRPLFSDQAWETATRLVGVVIILLRLKTTQSLTEKSVKSQEPLNASKT